MAKKSQIRFSEIYKIPEEEYKDEGYGNNTMFFYQQIMQGEYKDALMAHKALNEAEEEVIDEMVFNAEENGFTSENVRVGSSRAKNFNDRRKFVLKQAMICDASVGYWKLSK